MPRNTWSRRLNPGSVRQTCSGPAKGPSLRANVANRVEPAQHESKRKRTAAVPTSAVRVGLWAVLELGQGGHARTAPGGLSTAGCVGSRGPMGGGDSLTSCVVKGGDRGDKPAMKRLGCGPFPSRHLDGWRWGRDAKAPPADAGRATFNRARPHPLRAPPLWRLDVPVP